MKIAVFTKNLSNPAYEAARLGADRAAELFGAQTLHFVPTQADDPQEQGELIDQAIALAPDALVLSPVHATKVDAAIARIHAAGIPITAFVNPIHAAPCVSYVGSDDFQLARAIARHLFDGFGGSARVLVVSGPFDSFTSLARLRGFEVAAGEYPDITLVGRIAGDYQRSTARERTERWLAQHVQAGSLDACLVANDIMALGVLDALHAAGRSAAVVGVNAIPEAVQAIAAGSLLATADFNAMQMAFLATECALLHLRGEAVPQRIELPVQIVDASNCRHWDLPYAMRPLVRLKELPQ